MPWPAAWAFMGFTSSNGAEKDKETNFLPFREIRIRFPWLYCSLFILDFASFGVLLYCITAQVGKRLEQFFFFNTPAT
jgi:hypothetical protein